MNGVRRSVLYVPGSRDGAIERARALAVDVVVIDLEDAVAPQDKKRARDRACAAVATGGFAAREVVIRVNAPDTPWGMDDLRSVADAAPHAILLPKVSSADDVIAAGAHLARSATAQDVALWAMIETPRGVAAAVQIGEAVGCEPRLACLVVGLNDLAKDTRARLTPGRQTMLPWLSAIVLAARVSGLTVIDGVYNAHIDEEGLVAECRQARDLGFDGKSLIHPRQVDAANAAFSPATDEIAWAQKIVAAFDMPENAGHGAIAVDGQMLELLHLKTARDTLALAAELRTN